MSGIWAVCRVKWNFFVKCHFITPTVCVQISCQSPDSSQKWRARLFWTPGASSAWVHARRLTGDTALPRWTSHSIFPALAFLRGRGAWGEMTSGSGTHQTLGGLDKSGPFGGATPQWWYWRGVWATSGGFQCRKLPNFSVASCHLPAFNIWSLLSTIRIRNNNLLLSLAHCFWYTSMKSTPFVPWDF